jgi:arylsulfatase
MAIFAAMIEIMDRNVGRVVAALERNGALETTLILFLSDNGACAEGPTMGSQTHYGECWAHLSNTPLRLYKHFTCQGGVQTPFIAHWPAGIGERAGSLDGWTGSLTDVMPTCLELAGAPRPRYALDGVSLVPALRGAPGPRPDIFVEHEGNQMVRSGRWKLVRQHTDPLWELYDMEQDRSEMHGLGDKMPERLIDLARRYGAWEAQARVIPWERAGWYMAYHGYRSHGDQFRQGYAEAMRQADPADIVDGEALGD